jgi:hypothetical protein
MRQAGLFGLSDQLNRLSHCGDPLETTGRAADIEVLWTSTDAYGLGGIRILDTEGVRSGRQAAEPRGHGCIGDRREALSREGVQSPIRRHLGPAGDQRRVKPADAGIAEMMVDLYERITEPLDRVTLDRRRHYVVNDSTDLADIGRCRGGGDAMQIVSDPIHQPRVHFEAPHAALAGEEMEVFLTGRDVPLPWLRTASPNNCRSRQPPSEPQGNGEAWKSRCIRDKGTTIAKVSSCSVTRKGASKWL